jgi:lysozyme family protein
MVVQTKGPPPSPYVATTKGSNFLIAWDMTQSQEGVYVNDTRDPGGETKFGISKRAYPGEDIPNLTLERATFLAKRDYWFPMRLDLLNSQLVANNLFDFGFHHGVRGVVKKLQLGLARYFEFKGKVDGIMGSETINHLNEVISVGQGAAFALHQVMVKTRMDYYLATAKPEYLKGFIARANIFL